MAPGASRQSQVPGFASGLGAALLVAALLSAVPSLAQPLPVGGADSRYSVLVDAPPGVPEATAYAAALRIVLVQVTGDPSAAADAGLQAALGDVRRYVREARREAPNRLDVQFDAALLGPRIAAAGYGIRATDESADVATGPPATVTVAVSGIASLADYGRVLRLWQGLDVVERARVNGIRAGAVEYELELRGDRGALQRQVGLQAVLEALGDPASDAAAGAPLAFRLRAAGE
jgi:hypothetical protein